MDTLEVVDALLEEEGRVLFPVLDEEGNGVGAGVGVGVGAVGTFLARLAVVEAPLGIVVECQPTQSSSALVGVDPGFGALPGKSTVGAS